MEGQLAHREGLVLAERWPCGVEATGIGRPVCLILGLDGDIAQLVEYLPSMQRSLG